jgi:hypothetical protein
LPRAVWDAARLDDEPPPWDTVFLDANALWSEPGPALVLAVTALEMRIESALAILAASSGTANLWTWIMDRDDYRKQPSLQEKFDSLLDAVCGNSLKLHDSRLWEGFQNLRKARNSYVHDGQLVIGATNVSQQQAAQLLGAAGEILEWIDTLLPDSERRPTLSPEGNLEVVKWLVGEPPRG